MATALCEQVSVLYVTPDNALTRSTELIEAEEAGVLEVHAYYKASSHSFRSVRKATNLWRYVAAARAGWHAVLRARGTPVLVHVHILMRPALIALWLKWRRGIPFVISEQSSEYLDGTWERKHRVAKAWNRFLCRSSSGMTAVGDRLGAAMKELGLCDRYVVVPNVIPGTDRPLHPAGATGRFMIVADLVDRIKNVSGVIRALAQARKQDDRATLTVIGDGPDRPALERLVEELSLQGRVHFLGRLPNTEVLDHMANAFAVIINSYVETFSVVTGEALAQGKPVIATRCGGPVAFVRPENGLLIEPGDDDGLANAMLQVMNDAIRYDPVRIRESVNQRFSPAAVGLGFHQFYRSIAPDHGQ